MAALFLLASALLGRLPVAAGGRRLDGDGIARLHRGGVAALQPLAPAVLAAHPILADLPGVATGEPEGAHPAVARQDRALHRLQKADGPGNAVARIPAP